MKYRIVAAVVVIVAAYIATITLYATTGLGAPVALVQGTPSSDGTTVIVAFSDVHAVRGEVVANVTVDPGDALLDPVTHALTQDLSVTIDAAATPTLRTWTKGSTPGVIPVTVDVVGESSEYPFDQYHSGPIAIEMTVGNGGVPTRVAPYFLDQTPGWTLAVEPTADGAAPAVYQLDLRRAISTAAIVTIIFAALITIAVLALVVSVQTARDKRKFQPPMTTWFAAMLFAVVPLRNALPDAPPIGTWVDVAVVLWVIVALVGSMALYIVCWWRHLNPTFDKVK
ncbi:DUF4436 domain-containing protein [Mycolicibacterium sp. Dal123E01]|uniref:DUF4436 domain-containing protein n=1 Tax=Mycolicibacterium sp. Dal123E01 TaxID=3457578 RepID=UPI00403EA472